MLQDLREIGPTYFFAPPGIYQRILTAAMIRIEDAAAPKRALVRFFLDTARRVVDSRAGALAAALESLARERTARL